jgi:alkanesulfonate monooxygenase SsuD/methylene tetrahydromethanopterin reductase-like flavin-dependent oxidoreductase (luciferase family)
MTAAKPVRCGVAIPQDYINKPVDLPFLHTYLSRAEALGYESAWVQEQIVGSVPILEPVTLLTYAAALTRKLRLGTSVMLTVLRNPLQLAKSLTSLDQLSQGRLTVGVGLGNQRPEDAAFGISLERRVRRFAEGIEVMKALWTQPTVNLDGEFWKLDGISQEPRPTDFKAQVQTLRGFLDAAQRDPSTFTISKRVYIAVDDDKSRAEERLRTWFGIRYRSADMASRVAVWGNVNECLDRLAELVSYGAEHLLLNSAFDDMEHLELMAKEIVPHLAGAAKA